MSTYYGLRCRCGSRRTAREGESALLRRCVDCKEVYAYRLRDGLLIPMAPLTAAAWDERTPCRG